MGFPGLPYRDKRIYAAMVMLNILGGGMSSRLFVEVREKRGLAYMVRASMGSFRDCGVAQIQAGLDPIRLKEALVTINEEVKKISREVVSKQELRDAKNSLIGRLALALEDSGTQAERIAKQFWFFPKVESFAETKKKIQAVTVAEVKRIASELFDNKQMRLAVIGPLSKEKVLGCLK
jgi:predicted Zn-dependent peptidase